MMNNIFEGNSGAFMMQKYGPGTIAVWNNLFWPDGLGNVYGNTVDVAGLNVVFVDEFLTRAQVYELQACCDVLLSLHRAEGFGLAPAEMMFMGKPVIATGWSGNMDFMTRENSALVDYKLVAVQDRQGVYTMSDQRWAEPDIEQAAVWLRKLAADPELRRRLGMRAAKDATEFFGIERFRLSVAKILPNYNARDA